MTNKRTSALIACICLCMTVVMLFPNVTEAAVKTPDRAVISSAKAVKDTVQLTWKKTKNAKSYKIFVQTGADGWKYQKSVAKNSKNKKTYSDTLKYKLVASGNKYKVYTRKNPYKAVKTTTALKYTYKGKYDTTYRFVVQAVNGTKKGKYSAAKAVRTPVQTFTVKFVNDITKTIIAECTVKKNQTVEFPSPPTVTGYTFRAWDTLSTIKITSNKTITALYDKNNYTVRFINGANGTVIATETVEYGGSCSVPSAPAVSGKRFKSWSLSTANSGTITNISSDLVITANYVNEYTVTFIDGTTGTVCGTKKVGQGDSLIKPDVVNPYSASDYLQIAVPDHRGDSTRPFAYINLSPSDALNNIGQDVTITLNYNPIYIINWIDSFDTSLIKQERIAKPGSGTPPDFPSHTVNGTTITASDWEGYDASLESGWKNYRNVSDACTDEFGSHIITMRFIYPGSHHVKVIDARTHLETVVRMFSVPDGASATEELYRTTITKEDNFLGFTDEGGNAVTSLNNVTQDRKIYVNFRSD